MLNAGCGIGIGALSTTQLWNGGDANSISAPCTVYFYETQVGQTVEGLKAEFVISFWIIGIQL